MPSLGDLDPERDAVLMMEVRNEAEHVPSHRQRTVLFLSAMRHFALELVGRGLPLRYVLLDDPDNSQSFPGELSRAIRDLKPAEVHVTRSGEWRVEHLVDEWSAGAGVSLVRHEPGHFYLSPAEFERWADGRKVLVLEHFYRWMRQRERILLDEDGHPVGGAWNYDAENREPFRGDPAEIPPPLRFPPDAITREVIDLVRGTWPEGYGGLEEFAWPVTRAEARAVLDDFIEQRLPLFGRYQDAMRSGEPWMFHSLLAPALNLQLLDPRECVDAAVRAYAGGRAPLAAVEGFVRQILGWREFIRGVYWHAGPDYRNRNAFDMHGSLPAWYWTGDVDLCCLSESLGQVVKYGYGHHIQRLMVTGNFALIGGVDPAAISDWYLAMYVDAVDWVTLPNTLGMVMHADGGLVGTKPYAASGKYLERMSDYCHGCQYRPEVRTGPEACPFTTFYWDFLLRHEQKLRGNRRMALMFKSLERLPEAERKAISGQADELRKRYGLTAKRAADEPKWADSTPYARIPKT